MSAFVRPEKLPPIDLFAATLRTHRPSLSELFHSAFEAARLRNPAMEQQLFLRVREQSTQEVKDLHAEAYAQDVRADQLAALVLLVADDAMQRLGRAVLGQAPGVTRGFGKLLNGVPLTSLVRAVTNCYRHVSEWDDNAELAFPYENTRTTDSNVRRALTSIKVLQKALGVGRHERIWTAPTFTVLALIDGNFDTSPVQYERFENAVVASARDIVLIADDSALVRYFDDAIARNVPPTAQRELLQRSTEVQELTASDSPRLSGDRNHFVPKALALRIFRHAPRLDVGRLRADLDAVARQDPTPRS